MGEGCFSGCYRSGDEGGIKEEVLSLVCEAALRTSNALIKESASQN